MYSNKWTIQQLEYIMVQNQAEDLRLNLEKIFTAVAVATRNGATNSGWKKLAPAELAGMIFIGSHDGPKNSELAENIGVGVTTASALVDRMVKRGLVVRTRTEEDRRSVRLSLSNSGKILYAEALTERNAACEQMLRVLDEQHRAPFLEAMKTIANNYSKYND